MNTLGTLVATTALLTTTAVGATQWPALSDTRPATVAEASVPTQAPQVDLPRRPVATPPPPSRRPAPSSGHEAVRRPATDRTEPVQVLLRPGDQGPEVRRLQARLRQIDWFSGDVTDYFGEQTQAAVAGFQAKRGFPVTGLVDGRTLRRLEEMTVEPTAEELANAEPDVAEPDVADGAALDPRCLAGRVLCVDKSSSSLRWVVDGEVEAAMEARFGGNGYVTREGDFSVTRKSRDHVSSIYGTAMPFALFFDGGRAVHYSADFAAVGYAGASHGCVNVRDYDAVAALYDEVQVGDRVVVYWS